MKKTTEKQKEFPDTLYETCCKVLGLSIDSNPDEEEIEEAYKKLVWHYLDKKDPKEQETELKQLSVAKTILLVFKEKGNGKRYWAQEPEKLYTFNISTIWREGFLKNENGFSVGYSSGHEETSPFFLIPEMVYKKCEINFKFDFRYIERHYQLKIEIEELQEQFRKQKEKNDQTTKENELAKKRIFEKYEKNRLPGDFLDCEEYFKYLNSRKQEESKNNSTKIKNFLFYGLLIFVVSISLLVLVLFLIFKFKKKKPLKS